MTRPTHRACAALAAALLLYGATVVHPGRSGAV